MKPDKALRLSRSLKIRLDTASIRMIPNPRVAGKKKAEDDTPIARMKKVLAPAMAVPATRHKARYLPPRLSFSGLAPGARRLKNKYASTDSTMLAAM